MANDICDSCGNDLKEGKDEYGNKGIFRLYEKWKQGKPFSEYELVSSHCSRECIPASVSDSPLKGGACESRLMLTSLSHAEGQRLR